MPELSARKKEILLLAAELIMAKGFHATSMRDVAKAAAVQVSTLYSHFKSKEDMLSTICSLVMQELTVHESLKEELLSAKAQFKSMLKQHITYAITHPDFYLVSMQEWRQLQGEKLKSYRRSWKAYETNFVQIIQKNKIGKTNAHLILYTCLGAILYNCQHRNFIQPDKLDLVKQLSKVLSKAALKK